VPEPDIAIAVRASGKIVEGAHVLLAVEISDTTLDEDLSRNMRLYAAHGIPDTGRSMTSGSGSTSCARRGQMAMLSGARWRWAVWRKRRRLRG
jgi:hypothetical protein